MSKALTVQSWLKGQLARARRRATSLALRVGSSRFCPVCESTSRRFAPSGHWRRKEARCIACGSLERHRLLWLYICARTDLLDGRPKRMLHIAPERCLGARFRKRLGRGYVSADLASEDSMILMDIMELGHPDETFDVIYCSHVLEHVRDDRVAMRELRRVLRSDGWAILLVPVMASKTFEDPRIIDPEERARAYGRHNHLRLYGEDYPDRLREAGFHVEETRVQDLVEPIDANRMGLTQASGTIYRCTKR